MLIHSSLLLFVSLLFSTLPSFSFAHYFCGCPECDEKVFFEPLPGHHAGSSCGRQVEHLRARFPHIYPTEKSACLQIANAEYRNACAACDPSRCRSAAAAATAKCGCGSCDEEARNREAEGFTCGGRIAWYQEVMGYEEERACRRVAGVDFVDECGSSCDPDRCHHHHQEEEEEETADVYVGTKRASPIVRCGCEECDSAAWHTVAGNFSCGARIDWLMEHGKESEEQACRQVSLEFPDICGVACHPSQCGPRNAVAKAATANGEDETTPHCGCETCTDDVWNLEADGHTCGARISWLRNSRGASEETACAQVSDEFPTICGASCDPSRCHDGQDEIASTDALHCGCHDCTATLWNADADGFTCGSRIAYLRDHDDDYPDEVSACLRVARHEFPAACGPGCDPRRCDGRTASPFTPPPTLPPPAAVLTPTTPLYCFPNVDEGRMQYRRVWRKHRVEVKEGTTCGPGDNAFSRRTVKMRGNDLKLQFKNLDGVWTGSEVRIVHEADVPFTYGTYFFSVKSVEVKNGNRKVSNKLPKDLVLGLFTWDDLEDYSVHQNWNHEVDVEISQWGKASNDDVQFLVQPPGNPQMHRFSSGGNQGGQTYEFTWNPGSISWSSSHGAAHTYSSESSQQHLQEEDYVQCLPANMEIRMNLWNMYGKQRPSGFRTNAYRAEVVVDLFWFTSSGQTHVADGGYCGKHCHCGPGSQCLSGRCVGA